jgi:hypothetical protein
LQAASCARPAAPAAPAGYLAASGSSVAFLRWPAAARTAVTGTFELVVSSGTAPARGVSAHSYPFTGQVSGGRLLTVHIDGRFARGRLSGRRLPGSGPPSGGLALGPLPGSSRLAAMAGVASLAAGALAKTRRDARQAVARAHLGASRVQVCDYAVAVDSDALGVSAYSAGLGADAASLRDDMFALRIAITALAARLRAVQRQQPGYRPGGLAPAPAQVRRKISRARRRTAVVLARANGYVDLINLDVATGYRLSARASDAGTCRSASPAPAPLPRMG